MSSCIMSCLGLGTLTLGSEAQSVLLVSSLLDAAALRSGLQIWTHCSCCAGMCVATRKPIDHSLSAAFLLIDGVVQVSAMVKIEQIRDASSMGAAYLAAAIDEETQ